MIRTIVYPVDSNLPLSKLLNHPVRQFQELRFAVIASANAGLVGDNQQEIVHFLRIAAQFEYTLLEMELLLRRDIRMIEIDHAVSIQEEGPVFASRHNSVEIIGDSRAARSSWLARRRRTRYRARLANCERLFYGVAKRMARQYVALLDSRRFFGRHSNQDVSQVAKSPARTARQCYSDQSQPARRRYGLDHIGGI